MWVTLVFLTAGCQTAPNGQQSVDIQLGEKQTSASLGACQGASQHDGYIYLYGDAKPGVIRQYMFMTGCPPRLVFTGVEIALTFHGQNLINHPTGLTWNPEFGTYLGNTITATKKGTIYHLDWPRLLIDRNLDNAILNTIDDDLAVQGCRPEFVRKGQHWLLATSDYGQANNAVRYYEPAKLIDAHRTSEPGVLVQSIPCGPWVQQLHWIDELQTLLIIQNTRAGRGWQVTSVAPWMLHDYRKAHRLILPGEDELEGFTCLSADQCVLVTSSRNNNITFGWLRWAVPCRAESRRRG